MAFTSSRPASLDSTGGSVAKQSSPQDNTVDIHRKVFLARQQDQLQREPENASWDHELEEADFEDLRQLMMRLQPKYRPAARLVPEADLKAVVRGRLTVRGFSESQLRPANTQLVTSQHMNARLMAGDQPRIWEREGSGGPIHMPRLMIITGHAGAGGNVGLNGIYERYPDDYKGRPVYQKFLEKGPVRESPSVSRGHSSMGAGLRDFGANSPRTRILLDRQLTAKAHAPVQVDDGPLEIQLSKNAWFLYFYEGFWTIGPRVGSREFFARCPGSEDPVPNALANWEVWDMGKKRFYKHGGLRAFKGGK